MTVRYRLLAAAVIGAGLWLGAPAGLRVLADDDTGGIVDEVADDVGEVIDEVDGGRREPNTDPDAMDDLPNVGDPDMDDMPVDDMPDMGMDGDMDPDMDSDMGMEDGDRLPAFGGSGMDDPGMDDMPDMDDAPDAEDNDRLPAFSDPPEVPQTPEEDDWDMGAAPADGAGTAEAVAPAATAAGGGIPDPDSSGDDFDDFEEVAEDVYADELVILTDMAAGPIVEDIPGVEILRTDTLDALGFALTVLRVEEGVDRAELALALERLRPDARLADNAIYRPEADEPAPGAGAGEPIRPADRSGDRPTAFADLLRLPAKCPDPCRIGLIDTGVDHFHPALRGVPFVQRHFAPASRGRWPVAHGTAVASLLVGRDLAGYRGLYPDADLHVASVFSFTGADDVIATTDRLILALNWLLQSGIGVVNMSLTGPPNDLLHLAVQRAAARDVTIVAAVGNDGPAGGARYPAAYPETIGVTAVDARLGVFRRAHQGDFVTFAAPGVNILAADADQSYGARSGTSFAAPFVTAVIAAGGAGPSADDARGESDPVTAALARNAVDLGDPGRDPVYGYGLVRAAGAEPAP